MEPYFSAIPTRFDQRKAAAAAGRFLKLTINNRMKYIRLLKLLYMADRTAWSKHGRPITGDDYTAMEHGPVLTNTYLLIRAEDEQGDDEPRPSGPWHAIVERIGENDVRLRSAPDDGPLSDAEVEIIDDVYHEYRYVGTWDVIDKLHLSLPEWQTTYRGNNEIRQENTITPEKILKAVGQEEKIGEVKRDLEELETFEKLLGIR